MVRFAAMKKRNKTSKQLPNCKSGQRSETMRQLGNIQDDAAELKWATFATQMALKVALPQLVLV